MKLKHLIFVCAAALFAVACSDDDDEGGSKVTGPLATPSNVVYTPTESSIHFEWGKVANATSYEATLAPEDTPSSKETVQTTSTQCDFNNLESGYYIFTVMALYADNPEYNSSAYEVRVATLGLGVAVLDTPENLTVSAESFEATVSWDAVSGAAAYRIIISTGGGDIVNEIVTSTTYYAAGLESSTTYTVSVQALLNGSGEASEYDSTAATTTFTTSASLIAPTAKEVVTTYGMSILEWELSSAAQGQQALASDDPYEFRLSDANGNVLRLIENCNSWNFTAYKYQRVAFGGLEANTTYRLGVRRISQSSSYGPSQWAEVEVTTTVAPDKSGYLLYWDFENVPFCANPQYRAFGFKYSGNTETDYSDPNSLSYSGVNNESIWGEKIDPSANSKHNNQSFYDNYLPGLTPNDFFNQDTFNIAVSVGMLKFGGSSQQTWLTLPALDLTGTSDILVEFDVSPYYEPNGTTGDKRNPGNSDVLSTFCVEVTGGGTIDSSSLATGESDTGTIATLKLPTLDDGGSEWAGDDRYYFEPKSLVIKDATSSTRIKIYTVALSGVSQQRMWMDNIRISKR